MRRGPIFPRFWQHLSLLLTFKSAFKVQHIDRKVHRLVYSLNVFSQREHIRVNHQSDQETEHYKCPRHPPLPVTSLQITPMRISVTTDNFLSGKMDEVLLVFICCYFCLHCWRILERPRLNTKSCACSWWFPKCDHWLAEQNLLGER